VSEGGRELVRGLLSEKEKEKEGKIEQERGSEEERGDGCV